MTATNQAEDLLPLLFSACSLVTTVPTQPCCLPHHLLPMAASSYQVPPGASAGPCRVDTLHEETVMVDRSAKASATASSHLPSELRVEL